ncbi:hypothetical protein FGO68_gene4936 [Halteria grandinella]|uniref:Uncharacterized protein n=1 Tax=Halteria grandinella TaxID=5974 RepID=A0A8J8T915_HALGN|nr:hypothetical protein FGO68_gene4936 [Halteria grandinella]
MMILSFISISVPGLVQMIQSTFLSFIYMDLLQTDKWLPKLFFSEQSEEDEALDSFFEVNGFGSTRLINNLGSTFVFLMIFLGLHTFLFLLRCFFEGCTKWQTITFQISIVVGTEQSKDYQRSYTGVAPQGLYCSNSPHLPFLVLQIYRRQSKSQIQIALDLIRICWRHHQRWSLSPNPEFHSNSRPHSSL